MSVLLTNNRNQSFTSRSRIVRNLDDISMRVKREFPVVSNTYLETKDIYNKNTVKLYLFSSGLVDEIRTFSKQNSNPVQNIVKMLDSIKSFKVGNCGELSIATLIACKMNGIKDAKNMSLYAYNKKTQELRRLDHSFVGVGFNSPVQINNTSSNVYFSNNKQIIIDSWFGKTDFEKNMSVIYKEQLGKDLKKKLKKNEVLCYLEENNQDMLSRKDIIYLEHQYPQLLKNKKINFIDKFIYKYMNKNDYEFKPIKSYIKEVYRRNYHLENALPQIEISKLIEQDMKVNSEKKSTKKTNVFQKFMANLIEKIVN